MSLFTLTLAKEDFKFSCAHFTLFGPTEAEPLHGHNYQVSLELNGVGLDADGLLLGFVPVKKRVRALCEYLDSKTLIPTRSPYLKIREDGEQVEVRYHDRTYVLPKTDVLLIPIVNTTIECFSQLLWSELVRAFRDLPETAQIETLAVGVSETAGQTCVFRASVQEWKEIAPAAGELEGWQVENPPQ